MKIRPLNRSITIMAVSFIAILTAALSFVTYHLYTEAMYDRFRKQLDSIVSFAESYIDDDDMSECVRTLQESDKYLEIQALFDNIVDTYKDIHYIYILNADVESNPIRLVEICTGNTTYEKEHEPENVLHLGDWDSEWYSEETIRNFYRMQEGSEDEFYVNPSEWGLDYTMVRPLIDSKGRHYGALCADISIAEINRTIYRNIYINIGVILVLGLFFIFVLLVWMRRNVTDPLKALENSVSGFAGKSAGRRDPDELVYTAPEIRVRNEVKHLSASVEKLSVDMRDYVKEMIAAQDENRGLKDRVFTDALTGVKNKAAYDRKVEELNWDIVNNIAEFAIIMVDLNDLKMVNDRFGHEHGNEYIFGGCRMICGVFAHSPVYRIGGDEFAAVLQGDDYLNREALLTALKEQFDQHRKDTDAEPWERYSAAIGMSAYKTGDEVGTVFERADQEMYREKARMKAEQGAPGSSAR